MKKVKMPESKGVEESEEQLVTRAQDAVSQCRWVVGACASQWTARYARGRTDGDFAQLIGISADQVYQRRRVWDTFVGVRDEFPSLKWSHFYSALTWDDSHECLRWAEETRSTVAEMRAWRRARRGEDLSVESPEDEAVAFVPGEPEFVHVPAAPGGGSRPRGEGRGPAGTANEEREALTGVARQGGIGGDEYTPFRSGATAPPREEPARSGTEVPDPPSTEQLARRLSATLERFVKLMTPRFRREFRKLPEPVRERFQNAVAELTAHVAELS